MKSSNIFSNVRVSSILILSLIVFFPFTFTEPPYLYVLTTNLIFTVSTGTVFAYWKAAKLALLKKCRDVDYVDLLSLGIFSVFSALMLILGYTIILQFMGVAELAGEDVGTVYYIPQSFFRYLGLLGVFLHLAARPILNAETPTLRNAQNVALATLAGCLLTLAQISYLDW